MKKLFILIGTLLRWIWRIIAAGSILCTSLFFLASLIMVVAAFSFRHQIKAVSVPEGCALVLAPQGNLLEKKSPLNPLAELLNLISDEPQPPELLAEDIISGIQTAAKDRRIKLLVIAPSKLEQAGLDQIRDIGKAIEAFKKQGKVVLAYADSYSQGQYYLASWSDEIYLNPMGSVDLHGFGMFQLYLRNLLDKLDVSLHVFRVGAFKSAVEPFTRSDMSPEAKEDGRRWLTSLWDGFCKDIAGQRGILPQAVHEAADGVADKIEAAQGDAAAMAKNSGLIDGLRTKAEFREYLQRLVGRADNESGFKRIDFAEYLEASAPKYSRQLSGRNRVAILAVQGSIVYGKGGENEIGSADMIRSLRKLREDDQVKAIVLRLDSPGGSAFASELIRQELLLTRKASKPIVVSMASMAASGAYWIAADADKIFASPCTITGSIGIFGILPTFDKMLAKVGVFNDGIGTTTMAGAENASRPLSDDLRRIIQAQIEHGYRQFVGIVAQGRKMNSEAVEKIAQGRVWDGASARSFGLVDQLGSLDDAVAAAAAMVGLPPTQAEYFQQEESPAELLLRNLHAASAKLHSSSPLFLTLLHGLAPQYDFLLRGSDPQNMYSHCLLPGSVLSF